VFQIVPQRFQRDLGAVTGLIGAIGGVGGFFLPTLLGSVRQATGSFTFGFIVLAAIAAIAAISLRLLIAPRGRWSRDVEAVAVEAPGAVP
jgi:NNP family nitrate/nitrite transporter-like MFS transporter